ncbi:EAL domain-containing protein [Telmatospirillum sp.]|uniref:EAL domain-containing protein n=1 Tax=Telmatospirillum sp. TaxID=2079197 RepID=UPI0028430B60|nr:EAL domain-containing protein [Telmatospirillum sp.]MDR3438575.1 EAL domain-containing protein [Telmatospirillum sp.]
MSRTRPHFKTDKDRFVAFAFCWADLLFEVDPCFDIVFAAGPTAAFIGASPEDLVGHSIYDLAVPSDVPLFSLMLKYALRFGRVNNDTIRLKRPDGGMFVMSVTGYCIDGAGSNFFIAMRRRTWSTASSDDADKMASGLYDAQTFSQLASERVKQLREIGSDTSMTLVALPGLGQICRALDQDDQDRLRQKVGDTLKAGSVAGDSVAEVADGQYSVLHDSEKDLSHLLDHIQNITRSADPRGSGVTAETATVRMNGAAAPIAEEDLANGLLYMMNRFRETEGSHFNIKSLATNIGSICQTAAKKVTEFKGMIEGGHFSVALQPIIDIQTGEIHHYEALCRFHNTKPGESPYPTICFAEETGMIHLFDLAMAKKVIDWLAETATATGSRKPVVVAVNVSGHSVGEPSYVNSLHQLLRDNVWTRGRLLFEITESSRMTDLAVANTFIQSLRRAGYGVSLDDFGAGAASFQYLSSLEVDVVKLDGSAIRNAERAQKGRAFLSALTELCRRLNVKTIAEMVDSPERFNFCRDCGCDYVQGYLFGKPSTSLRNFQPVPHANLFRIRRWENSNFGQSA